MLVLRLNRLAVDCVIGDLPEERTCEQRLEVSVELFGPLGKAAETDVLADGVDYAALAARIRSALVAARCRLIERAAVVVAEICKKTPGVERVTARVVKKGRVEGLESAEAEVTL